MGDHVVSNRTFQKLWQLPGRYALTAPRALLNHSLIWHRTASAEASRSNLLYNCYHFVCNKSLVSSKWGNRGDWEGVTLVTCVQTLTVWPQHTQSVHRWCNIEWWECQHSCYIQTLSFRNVLKPLVHNTNSKIIQSEKRRFRNLMTQ
jgi:hypothetical protein